jgi:hypothetical protein
MKLAVGDHLEDSEARLNLSKLGRLTFVCTYSN